MKNYKVFKTKTFKLHDLTNRKKALIDKTMKQNVYAFYFALRKLTTDAEQLLEIKTKPERKEALIQIKKKCAEIIKPLPFGSAVKASTIEEVTAQISSYVELVAVGQAANLPARFDIEIDYYLALERLLLSTTEEEENAARDEINRTLRDQHRPLTFLKSRTSDGFLLLSDNKNRLFTFVNLWSSKDKRAEKIKIDMINTRDSVHVQKSTATGLLLPIECSDYHKEGINNAQSKSAKLFKKDGEYFLAVSFEYEIEPRETITFLGVDRGYDEIISYCVRAENGKILSKGNLEGETLRAHQRKYEAKQKEDQRLGRKFTSQYSNYSDNLMHHICNEVVSIADHYNSQVVIEDLSALKNSPNHKRKAYASKSNFNRMLSRQQFGKAEFMLNYKLNAIGLPKPKLIHAAHTSLTCPVCGHSNKENRPTRDLFYCIKCHYKDHADTNGACNIAGKRIWFSALGSKIKGNKKEEYYFNNWQADNLIV